MNIKTLAKCGGWILSIGLMAPAAFAHVPSQKSTLDLTTISAVRPEDDSLLSPSRIQSCLPAHPELFGAFDPRVAMSQDQEGVMQRTQIFSQVEDSVHASVNSQLRDWFMNSDFVKNSPLAQMGQKIQKAAQKTLGQATVSGVPQKFTVNVDAIQRQAAVNYEGFFNSAVTYVSQQQNMSWSLWKNLNTTTTVSFTNTIPVGPLTPGNSSYFSISKTF